MTYDVDNRLDTYTQTEGTKVTTQSNLYNGDGQRIQKQEGDNTINYFYQDGNVLYTTNGDGDKTSHNFRGLEGNTISTIRYNLSGLEYYVYNKDIKGSTSNIVDNNNNAKISYIYSDFGETEEVGDKTFYNEICYTGGIYDESTSLYYLNARYYNPEDARFITQDTYRGEVNEPSTLHLYAYCSNNPINYIDITGNFAIPIAGGIGVVAIITLVVLGHVFYYASNALINKLKKQRPGYYVADLLYSRKLGREDLFISNISLSTKEAKSRVKYAEQNVWAKSQNLAYKLAYSIYQREPLHDSKYKKGYYRHYHAKNKIGNNRWRKNEAHIFYGSKM